MENKKGWHAGVQACRGAAPPGHRRVRMLVPFVHYVVFVECRTSGRGVWVMKSDFHDLCSVKKKKVAGRVYKTKNHTTIILNQFTS